MESISLSGQPPIVSSEESIRVEAEAMERNQSQQQNMSSPQSNMFLQRKERRLKPNPKYRIILKRLETGMV